MRRTRPILGYLVGLIVVAVGVLGFLVIKNRSNQLVASHQGSSVFVGSWKINGGFFDFEEDGTGVTYVPNRDEVAEQRFVWAQRDNKLILELLPRHGINKQVIYFAIFGRPSNSFPIVSTADQLAILDAKTGKKMVLGPCDENPQQIVKRLSEKRLR